jgi:tetratricopeptide (TPR) repeat protein
MPAICIPHQHVAHTTITLNVDVMTDMSNNVAKDHDSNIPLPTIAATRDGRHPQTTSASTTVYPPSQSQPNGNMSEDFLLPPGLNTRTPVYLDPAPTGASRQSTVVTSGITQQHGGKTWYYKNEPDTGKLGSDSNLLAIRANLKPTSISGSSTQQRQSVPHLNFSVVQEVLSYSPLTPIQTPSQPSPISLGPQSSHDSQWARPPSPQPPSPDRNDMPKYMSAFEFAINAYLEDHADRRIHLQLPSPKLQNAVSEVTSPLVPHFEEDGVSGAGNEENETKKDILKCGIPSHLKAQNNIRISIRLMHLRTLLMQCTVLQSIIRDLERQCWKKDAAHSPYRYYSKMRQLALKARQLAEELKSQDLQARCEYWAGRACGGTKDYQEAVQHFESAINLDVQNSIHPSGRLQLRGLRPREKDDVRFLLNSVKDRYKSWESKTAEAMNKAKSESDRTGISVEVCFEEEWKGQSSPPWLPDRDRVVYIARQKHVVQKTMEKRAKVFAAMQRAELAQPLDEKVQDQWEREGVIEGEMVRRTLSNEEWRYIWYGDEEANKRRVRQADDAQASKDRPTPGIPHDESPSGVTNLSPVSASSSQQTPHEVSPRAELSLAEELEGL